MAQHSPAEADAPSAYPVDQQYPPGYIGVQTHERAPGDSDFVQDVVAQAELSTSQKQAQMANSGGNSMMPSEAAPVASEKIELQYLVDGAQTLPPFKDVIDLLGEGPASLAQKMEVGKTRDAAMSSAKAGEVLVNVGYNLPALIIEIIRDFWQIMSLVLSVTFDLPDVITNFLGRLAFAISLDIGMLLPVSASRQDAYNAIWWVMFSVGMACSGTLRGLVNRVQPDARREFTMLRTWAMLDKSLAKKMRIITFVLTLLYLPLSQYAVEITMCSHKYYEIHGHCASWIYIVTSIISLVIVTIGLPIQLFRIIRENVPKIREFDERGEPHPAPERDYLADLARKTRKNPVASLFNEYHRPMRYHKVTIMFLKLYLILVAVLLSSNEVITGRKTETKVTPGSGGQPPSTELSPQAETPSNGYNHVRPILMIVGLIAYTIFCIARRPFISSLANVLDVLLRITAVLAVTCGYLISFDVAVDEVAIVFVVILAVMLVASIVFIVFAFDRVQEGVRIAVGDVKLTPVSEEDNTPLWFKPGFVDYARERKIRVWQDFWTNLLVHYEGFKLRPPPIRLDDDGKEVEDEDLKHERIAAETGDFEYVDNDDTTAYLLDFKGSIAERHIENAEIAGDIGAGNFTNSLLPLTPQEIESVVYTTRVLHGRDTFWDPGNGGQAIFGCLYLLPIPYEAFFAPDDGEEVRLSTSDLPRLIEVNANQEVMRRRRVREQLRGLARVSETESYNVYFVFQEQRTIQINDGVDAQGRAKTRSVTVQVTYQTGRLSITGNAERPTFAIPTLSESFMAIVPGFNVALTFSSGTYTEHGGGTVGERTIGKNELGIYDDMRDTEQLGRLINENIEVVKRGHMEVLRLKDSFRRYFMSEFLAKALTLSYTFWPAVFNNDRIPKDALRNHLGIVEFNESMRSLATDEAMLGAPYTRLQYYDSCPAVALWVCFWHDLYYRNLDMSMLCNDRDVNGILNPFGPDALIWNVMCKEGTNEVLQKVGLQKPDGGGFINKGLIDKLYDAMAYSMDTFSPEAPSAHVLGANEPLKPVGFFEVQRHAQYAASIIPRTMENFQHPGLELVVRMSNGATNDFYPDLGDTFTHYQRYPIIANAYGGQLPDDAYYP